MVVQKALQAQQLLQTFKKLSAGHADQLKGQGQLEVQLAAIILDKKKVRTCENLESACYMAATELGLSGPSTWKDAFDKEQAAASSTPPPADASSKESKLQMRTYDAEGNVQNEKQLVQAAGFVAGLHVVRRDKTQAIIKTFHESEVGLELDDGSQAYTSYASILQGEWKAQKASRPQEEIEWTTAAPKVSDEWRRTLFKAEVIAAMGAQLDQKKCEGIKDLKVFKNPKSVQCTKAFPVHKLQIPCCSPKVSIVPMGKGGASDICIGTFENMEVMIAPYTKPLDPEKGGSCFMNPFHCIPKSTDPDEVTMEMHPTLQALKMQKLKLGKEITLPIMRNTTKLEPHAELCVLAEDDASKRQGNLEVLRKSPKRARTSWEWG